MKCGAISDAKGWQQPDQTAFVALPGLAQIDRTYRFSVHYGVGDVVIWDNAAVLHSATLTAPDDPRPLARGRGGRPGG